MRLPSILPLIASISIACPSTAFAADEPPSRDAILRAMPRAVPFVYRDDVMFSTVPIKPGIWQCTVSYRQTLRLPWCDIPLGWGTVRRILPN